MIAHRKIRFFVILISFLLITSLNNSIYSQEQSISTEVTLFLKTFEAAVLSGDAQKVMSLMEEDYRRAQHDALLKGNTIQFLNEFQCGYREDNSDVLECIDFGKVSKMQLTSILPDENIYIITYKLTGPNSSINVTWIISVINEGGKTTYGMVGAYG